MSTWHAAGFTVLPSILLRSVLPDVFAVQPASNTTSHTMPRYFLITASVLLWTSSFAVAEDAKPDEMAEGEKVTFADDVLPIFRSKCGSCHNANDKKGGLVLDNYSAMMLGGSSGTAIEPGDAGNSYLWSLITHESEPKMPPAADKLPADQLAVIEKWINLGALENAGSKAKKKKKSNLGKVEITTSRPAEVAVPQRFFGESAYVLSHANAVTALATSPWASLTAVSGYKQVSLYDSDSMQLLGVLPFPEGKAHIAKFSRDGSLLLVGGGRGGESGRVIVFDVRTGDRIVEVGEEYDEVLAADISSDQTMIALGGPKKMLRVYSVETGELLYEMKKHTDWITAVEFSPDGVLLASGDRSNGLVVWEAPTGQLFYDLQGHRKAISDISWRPDSNVVASASEDGTVKMWEMQNGNLIKSFDAHGGGVTALDYTRDGEMVTTGRDHLTRFWNGEGNKIRDLPGVADIAMEISFDAEKRRILVGDWTGLVTVFNADDASVVGTLTTNPPTVKEEVAKGSAKVEALKAQLQAQQAGLDGIQANIASRANAATAYAATVAQADAAVKQAVTNQEQADAALKAQQENLKTAEQSLTDGKTALDALKTQLEQAAEKPAEEVAALNASIAESTAKVESLNQAFVAAQEATNAAQAALDSAVQSHQQAEKGLADANAMQIQLNEAAKVQEEEQKGIDVANAAIAATQAQLATAEASLARIQQVEIELSQKATQN
ncbi:c-type cytochrome domain-containing protein [Planctomicrobium sp. SH668]|uniref:c-type cytochrome domain-containing protein n=1 Tax=Planctomicrobium sp. SH668 TaxID=3448126 RepID=UPI003F5B1DE3